MSRSSRMNGTTALLLLLLQCGAISTDILVVAEIYIIYLYHYWGEPSMVRRRKGRVLRFAPPSRQKSNDGRPPARRPDGILLQYLATLSTMTAASSTHTTTTSATPWVEKYRPKSLTDVSHQTEIISTLTNAVETNRLPHLLFYGECVISCDIIKISAIATFGTSFGGMIFI